MRELKLLPILVLLLCFAACFMLDEALAACRAWELQEPHLPQRSVQVLQLQSIYGGVPIGGRG